MEKGENYVLVYTEKNDVFNLFHANGLFWYPLKTSENLWFSDVFRGYQKRQLAWNRLTTQMT